jgi:hypothetical protein
MAIMDRYDRLADSPWSAWRTTTSDPASETLGYRRRAVIAFTVTEATVEIIGVVEAESVAAPTTGPHPANPRRGDLLRGP